ncbi:MAG: protein TolR [Oligoflexia bacterium]|nr:protein TolR [Oligoflexia bacterium]
MAGANGYTGDGPVANINVTPLVDVMLVLLVIFMVTAPMLQQGVEVNLPKASTSGLKGSSEQVVLSVDKEGNVYLGAGNKVDLETMPAKVKAIMDTRDEAERKIYIKADTALQYGRIMEVMGRLHEAGITQIGLVSAPGVDGRAK